MEVDLRFSLKDVCSLTGISHQPIRTYENTGVLPRISEEGNGYRYYHLQADLLPTEICSSSTTRSEKA